MSIHYCEYGNFWDRFPAQELQVSFHVKTRAYELHHLPVACQTSRCPEIVSNIVNMSLETSLTMSAV